jgi:hypothetical protein
MSEIEVNMSAGANVTLSDDWNPEKRESEGRIVIAKADGSSADLTLSASEAALLSNAFSKLAWSIARRDRG